MIRNFSIAAALAAATLTAPAFASTNDAFTGARVEVTGGYVNLEDREDATYTGAIGADNALSDRVTLGVEATAGNAFDKRERLLGLSGRIGYAFDTNTLGYAKVGYANLNTASDADRNLGGVVFGAGLQQVIPGSRVYATVQYDYTDFARGLDSHAVRAGLGVRF